MPRRCSHCSNNGHNSRTCPTRAGGGGGGGVMLFGVRLSEGGSMKKSASMGSLSHYASSTSAQASPNPGSPSSDPLRDHDRAASGYASDDPNHVSCSSGCRSERKKGIPWTEEEHRMFLVGLQKLGKGDWRGIARNFVVSRTPTQVASHAQKYFIRQTNATRRRRRTSLFDMVPDTPMDMLHSTGVESETTNPLPLLHLSLDRESKLTEFVSDNPLGKKENLRCSNFPPLLRTFYPPYVPVPCPIWPSNIATPSNEDEAGEAHEVLKPTPVLPKDRVHADELVGMSKLSLSEAAAARLVPSALSLKLLGASSSRQSAFQGNPTVVAGSDLSASNKNAIHAV